MSYKVNFCVEVSENPAFFIGQHVLVHGITDVVHPSFTPPRRGRVIGIAFEFDVTLSDVRMTYHIMLEDGAHCYSTAPQLEEAKEQ